MKINKVNASPSFKARLSPELNAKFAEMMPPITSIRYSENKLRKNLLMLYNMLPHVSISIEKYNKHGQEFFAYTLSNAKTGEVDSIGFFVDKKDKLFTPDSIDIVKYRLLDIYNDEKGISKLNRKPYMDVFM